MDRDQLGNILALDEARARKRKQKGEDEEKNTQAQELIGFAYEAELYHTPEGECWATVLVGDHRENYPVRSKFFRRWLVRKFFEVHGKPPGSQAVQDAVGALEAMALFDGPECAIFNRLAEANGAIYLDLCNEKWQAVKVTPSGWEIVNDPPVKFRRAKGMLPLPRPERGGDIEELRQFVNVTDGDWPLVLAWAVAALKPTGPYPILVLQGEQGSAKSTTARVLRELVDPSIAPLRTTPREERDLAITASNSWVLSYDNLSGIPTWLSDAFCRVATGGGFVTRALFTDDEEVILNFMRPVVINGIDDVVTRHDLLDRSIVVNLPAIPENRRKPEEEFWREFSEAKPRILGALLSAVSAGLKNINGVKLEKLPRMADFARWITACEPALPWPVGGFMEVYDQKRAEAVDQALEADAVAQAIKELLTRREFWSGTATELLDELNEFTPEQTRKLKTWPQTGRGLSNRLRRAATFLRQAGVEVAFTREPGSGRRVIRIKKKNIVTIVTPSQMKEKPLLNVTL